MSIYNPLITVCPPCLTSLLDHFSSIMGRLVVRASLTAVANQLKSANNLSNSEETKELGKNDTASGELGSADIPGLLDEVL